MSELIISASSYDEAVAEGMKQLGIPAEAVEIETMSTAHDDTLPGAEPLPGVTVRLRVKTDVLVNAARTHLKRMMELMGLEAHIEVLNRKRGVTLNIMAGQDDALIIGKNGQTLDALQCLINRMIARGTRELPAIVVDSEGYKEKRMSRLEDTAMRAAARAVRRQEEIALEPMSPSERRIVHLALKDLRGVHTISRGEDLERHVVVTPVEGETPDPQILSYRTAAPRQGGGGRYDGPRGRFQGRSGGGGGGGGRPRGQHGPPRQGYGGRGGQGGGGQRGGRPFRPGGFRPGGSRPGGGGQHGYQDSPQHMPPRPPQANEDDDNFGNR